MQQHACASLRAAAPPTLRAARRCPKTRCRAAAPRVSAASSPAGGATLSVTLRRPLGIVFEERVKGAPEGVFVDELVPGGNAAKAGVAVGDVLLRCSATVLKDGKEGAFEKEGYGARPFTNFDRVMFDASGQDFDTVMGAIASNNERWGIMDVVLEFSRAGGSALPKAAAPAAAAAAAAPAAAPAPPPPAAASTLVEVDILSPTGACTKARRWLHESHELGPRPTLPAWPPARHPAPRLPLHSRACATCVPQALVSGEPDGTLRDLMKANTVGVYDAWGSVWNCNGGGQCGLCTVDVLAGGELLTERTEAEGKHLTRKGKPDSWRLSCQACVKEGATGALKVQAQPQGVKK
jgi:ferredoxin